MSKFEIKMPKLGESITEGTIVSMNVKLGDMVEEDQVLFEVTTAKVSAEVPSVVAGKIVEMKHQEGDTVEVGLTVMVIDMSGEGAVVESSEATAPAEKAAEAAPAAEEKVTEQPAASAESAEDTRWYSPVVQQLAKQAKISDDELAKIPGTGFSGRLTKKDITAYIEKRPVPSTAPRASERPAATAAPAPSKPAALPKVDFGDSDVVVQEMDAVGKIIADRMVQSKHTSPHVTTVIEVDVTKLVNWRSKKKDEFRQQEGINLTYMPAIIDATTRALKEFPKLNASVDGYNFILKKDINIGVAVALEDENLIVPVVKNADKLSISGLAHSVDSLSKKARANKLEMSDIEGGTFTITNFGTFKNIMGTPIINQPEVAILGVGFIEKKPAVIGTPEGDVIAIRHKMYLSLSYDHRIVNGAVGGEFLYRIATYLENWSE